MSDAETPAHGKNIIASVQNLQDKLYTSKTNKSYKNVLLLIKVLSNFESDKPRILQLLDLAPSLE
jgi:hypothetical protein